VHVIRSRARFAAALGLALTTLLAPVAARAQSVAIVGSLANFDVLNNTGQDAHGFEIQIEGIQSADIYRIFGYWPVYGGNVIRYGAGTAIDYPGGVYVRWTSPWDPATQTFTQATPVPTSLTMVPGESCWTVGMGANYWSAGCEHFGISATKNPTAPPIYRWLVADPQNPGSLTYGASVSIPAPTWTVTPPAVVGNPPVVVAEIAAPPAPEPVLFGDAQWVKVYKTEIGREVQLEELVGDNPNVVPEDAAHLEVSWNLIQQDPQVGGNQKRKGRQVNQGGLGDGSHAVVRRYEYYQYAGVYDPITHEALCGGDGSCNAPLDGELGDAIGAQNAAANVNAPSLTVARTGNGGVSSSDKVISCGNKCFAYYDLDTPVTLTATPGSGSVFAGWSGACSGAQAGCMVSVSDAITANATFLPQFTLSIGRGGSGTVTGVPAGNDRAINCGSSCSAKFTQGATVTLSATPAVGLHFVSWTGACSGTTPTCMVTIAKDTTVQANFK
jgi:hypothetical protein